MRMGKFQTLMKNVKCHLQYHVSETDDDYMLYFFH